MNSCSAEPTIFTERQQRQRHAKHRPSANRSLFGSALHAMQCQGVNDRQKYI